jgi:predicted ATPase
MLTKVTISNFKSIASCEVHLGPLTFLVGLNGAGKSNFIDALRFCRDALRISLDQAFAARNSNLHRLSYAGEGTRSGGFALRFDLSLPGNATAHYSFSIGPQSPRGFAVLREECFVRDVAGKVIDQFTMEAGNALRLHLVNASANEPFRNVYEALEGMEFYNSDPETMKLELDSSGKSDVLLEFGRNIPSVLERIEKENPQVKDRIDEYLKLIVPGLSDLTVKSVDFRTLDSQKFVSFRQDFQDSGGRVFTASSMSDGTLRALAILVALFQRSAVNSKPTLVAIEEPEAGLHPAVAEVLFDALSEGALHGQVLVTSHSPDLLDNREISAESILAVEVSNGTTVIGPLDAIGRSTLRDHLYTAGELLRMNQLKPQMEDTPQPVLFEA